MKNIFQSLSIATLLGLFVPFISSCSDDEEVFDEVENDSVMQKLWEAYRKKFSYADRKSVV